MTMLAIAARKSPGTADWEGRNEVGRRSLAALAPDMVNNVLSEIRQAFALVWVEMWRGPVDVEASSC